MTIEGWSMCCFLLRLDWGLACFLYCVSHVTAWERIRLIQARLAMTYDCISNLWKSPRPFISCHSGLSLKEKLSTTNHKSSQTLILTLIPTKTPIFFNENPVLTLILLQYLSSLLFNRHGSNFRILEFLREVSIALYF